MYAIDTDEKLEWLLDLLENGQVVLDNREKTEEEWAEISRELAEYRAAHPKAALKEAALKETPAPEPALA